jgi:hypothetical protein
LEYLYTVFRANLFSVSVVQDASQKFILHNRNRLETALSGLPQSWETHTGEVS